MIDQDPTDTACRCCMAEGYPHDEGAKAMENLKSVAHIVMDKTGTLTEGELRVSSLKITEAWTGDVQTLCTLICGAEDFSTSSWCSVASRVCD